MSLHGEFNSCDNNAPYVLPRRNKGKGIYSSLPSNTKRKKKISEDKLFESRTLG